MTKNMLILDNVAPRDDK